MSLAVFVEFVGSIGILVPFALFQLGRMSQHGLWYLITNAAGSVLLTIVAALTGQWGFVILQGVWALAACYGIIRWRPQQTPPPSPSPETTQT